MFWSDNALLGMFLTGDDKKALCVEGSPAEEEREHHGSWWRSLYFCVAHIFFIYCIKLYEETSTTAEEVYYLLDWTGVIRNQSTDWERKSVNIESWNCSGGCCLTWVKGKERKELVRLQEIREESQEPRQPTITQRITKSTLRSLLSFPSIAD